MAKVFKPLDAGRAMDLEFEAWHAARELGYNAPELEQAPIMLNHESFLLLAWREGQADRHGRDAIEANAASDSPDVHILYCPRGGCTPEPPKISATYRGTYNATQ